jgi:serine protease Do
MTMRKYLLTSIAVLPLLLNYSHAAQTGPVDPPGNTWIFSSDEGGSSSYLGVDIADVTAERMGALKLKEEKGVEVTMVDQDAPAGKAGIREHDVIQTMNGTSVDSAAQLRRMIHETPAGRVVTFGLSRDGQPLTVKVQLGDRRKEMSEFGPKAKDFHIEMPDIHIPDIDIPSFTMVMATTSMRSGLTVENITPQLGEFFGVKNGNGVLVRAVEKGSRAEKAGFRAGDVIVKVSEQAIHDTSDFTHAVHSRAGNSVSIGVVRDKKEQNLNLALPEHRESGDLHEESADDSLLGADRALELSDMQLEIADLQPEMELAKEYARESAQQARKSLCQAQKEVRQQTRKQQDAFRKQQEELRKEMERMSERVRRVWFDI